MQVRFSVSSPRMGRCSVIGCFLVFGMLVGCASDNDHFCAKYAYYYGELTEPGILPIRDLREQLRNDLADPSKDPNHAKIALFVLNDIESQVKPEGEDPQEYCHRRELWRRYQ